MKVTLQALCLDTRTDRVRSLASPIYFWEAGAVGTVAFGRPVSTPVRDIRDIRNLPHGRNQRLSQLMCWHTLPLVVHRRSIEEYVRRML